MKSKYLVATSVAALAMFATAQVTSAQADPTAPPPPVKKHHHHHHDDAMMAADASTSASNPKEAADAQKVDMLEQRVEALESEVQSSEQREATAETQMSGYADKMTGWWDDTKISGRMYYDITDIQNTHQVLGHPGQSNRDGDDGASFDIKRFYIGIDHNFNSWLSANITTDVNFNTGTKASATTLPSATGYQLDLYVKYAYVQASYDDALNVRIGSAAMPWIPYDEDIYGYRFVEKTLVDRVSFGNSADWGLHVFGKFWGGLVDYQVSAVNGSGYKNPTRTQQPDVEGRIGFHWEGFQAAVGAYNGVEGFVKCGTNIVPLTNCNGGSGNALHHHYTRLDALVAYTWNGLKVGGEYFYAQNHGAEAAALTTNTDGYGYEGFASYQIDPMWSVFGRYDYVHPTSGSIAARAFHNNYYNAGVDYSPMKWVDFALVYKHDAGADGSFSDANGTIGGSAAFASPFTNDNGTYSEVGLFGQVRW
jgi:hypothetical protein